MKARSEGGRSGRAQVFEYKNGVLSNGVFNGADGGKEFGAAPPRFPSEQAGVFAHRTQNKMYTYALDGGKLKPEIVFRADTLKERRTSGRGRRRARCTCIPKALPL